MRKYTALYLQSNCVPHLTSKMQHTRTVFCLHMSLGIVAIPKMMEKNTPIHIFLLNADSGFNLTKSVLGSQQD